MAEEQVYGLSTKEALGRLHEDLAAVLREKDWTGGRRAWVMDSLDPRSPHTTVSWPSVAAMLFAGLALLVAAAIGDESAPNALDGLIVLFLLSIVLATALWDGKLRRSEMIRRAWDLVTSIQNMQSEVQWTEDNYPNIASPTSPCITLQWAWRDGHVVNLPWALLVRGDVILLRPGQIVPGLCTPVEEKNGQPLHAREVFNPQVPRESLTLPAARAPLESRKYLLLETPYTKHLRLTLEEALTRPISFHDKERHLIVTQCVEQTALPLIMVFIVLVNIARQLYLDEWFGRGPWWDSLVVQPINAGLPLMPLSLPLVWRLMSAWGVTKLRAILQDTTPAHIGHDPFEDADLETSSMMFSDLWGFYKDDLLGRGPLLSRSANVVHVLGSVTALCCVDKKGLLSWPNPTAEKVFFLRQPDDTNDNVSVNSEGYDSIEPERNEFDKNEKDPLRLVEIEEAVAEVLDLTHDLTSPFRLYFDDQTWKQYLNSLKPLGLAILLNTCNAQSQEVYSQFCCHLTCEAAQNESLVPVTNRRCLCELASLIGFMDQAQDSFILEQMLCTFQHVRPETVKRDIKFARQLSKSTKLKFPFPHMVATVLRDKQTSCLQLMSQGTADVILDSCVEYWDGFDLHPLTPCVRKKILDFYQRTSLTANCTAFAYRPLSKTVSQRLAQVYLEVPPDSRHLYLPYRSPTPLALSLFDAKWRGVLAQFHSSDSLLGMDGKEEEVTDIEGWFELQCNQVFVGMVTMQYQAQADVVHLVEQLERACIRFVHFSKENELRSRVFSEKMGLESGWNCHISLLSDRNRSDGAASCLGSKVDIPPSPLVTPKITPISRVTPNICAALQLDAQLLNERSNLTSSRAMSFSAPSAINMDLLTVKFDEQVLNWAEDSGPATTAFSDRRISQDSVTAHSVDGDQWRSLSCLTDSTDQSVPFAFDISNRAKLPRGIDKIRPHLEQIDNVPLLVSLFTDCTSTVTREMLHIMQEYGEVVCVFGSSANWDNVGVFLQADASIAVEPLYPQVCQKLPVFLAPIPRSGPSPVELSRALNSLPCAVSMKREDPLSLFQLITCARDFCLALRNLLQFWLCCVCTLSAFMIFTVLLMLPPPLNSGQILFISCLLIPLLSSSLMALPTDPQVMQKATGKNQCNFNVEAVGFVIWCYGLKCLPSVILLILSHLSGLSFFCQEIARVTNGTCSLIFPSAVLDANDNFGAWNQYGYTMLYLQHATSFLFVLLLVASSASYVHRDKLIWRSRPTQHLWWCCAVVTTIMLQVVYTLIVLSYTPLRNSKPELSGVQLPWTLIVAAFTAPVLIVGANEAVKWQEMKVNKRFQRRKRLDFGTKLGMNSPF